LPQALQVEERLALIQPTFRQMLANLIGCPQNSGMQVSGGWQGLPTGCSTGMEARYLCQLVLSPGEPLVHDHLAWG
jgi:hypothetical protein